MRLRRGQAFAAAIAATALLVAGCSTAREQGTLPDYVRAELDAGLSDFQRAILEDGVVTPAEYEQAVLATLSCLDAEGIPHSEPVLQQSGPSAPRWDYTVGPWPIEEDERFSAIYRRCLDEYQRAVASAWSHQEGPTESEMQALRQKAVECFRRYGLDASDYETFVATESMLSDEERAVALNCKLLIFRGVNNFD